MMKKNGNAERILKSKSWLPSTWEIFSEFSGENQSLVRIGHINPENHADPMSKAHTISTTENETVYAVGTPTIKGKRSDFFDVMIASLNAGYLPGWSMGKIQKFRGEMGEAHPEKYDLDSDITIAEFQDEETARQTLLNYKIIPERGFLDMKVSSSQKIPGIENLGDLLKSDYLKPYMSKEQLKQLEENLSKVSAEVKNNFSKSSQKGFKYEIVKFMGHEAVCMEAPNLSYSVSKVSKPKKSASNKFMGGGGGYINVYDPLPKIERKTANKFIIYYAVLAGNFIVAGSLLQIIDVLPSGSTPCYSLKRFKKKTTITKEGGGKFKDTAIIPEASTYEKEGYFHKEEAEKIFDNIFKNIR